MQILSLSDITSKTHTVALFVIVNLQTVYHTLFVGMFMLSPYQILCTKLQWYVSIRHQTETKLKFSPATILVFYIVQDLIRSFIFFENILPYII
jgi:hypothetical protein